MQKSLKRLMQSALAIIFFLFSLNGIIGGVYCAPAYATSSPVLDDLRTDSAFDVMQYPTKVKDGSLNVIQVAESTDGELLIYVYQPSGRTVDLRATSINIAREFDNSVGLGFNNYPLTFLNANGVFYKYKVENFELRAEAVRYYNISNILRPFNIMFDGEPENGNTVNEVKNVVGQLWTACTVGDDITYTMRTTEIIEITDMYVGYVGYTDGAQFSWGGISGGSTLAHFVAFNTDKQIDKLMSAKVYFCEREVTAKYCCNIMHVNHKLKDYYDIAYGDKTEHEPVDVNSKELAGNQGGGITGVGTYAEKYTWDRIQSTSDFIKGQYTQDYKLTTEGIKDIAGSQWVLSFHETQNLIKGENGIWLGMTSPIIAALIDDPDVKNTIVSDVTILQLMFETDGVTYNLGAVSNKQTGDGIADNEFIGETVADWVWVALAGLAAVVIIVILVLLSVYVPGFAQGLGKFAVGVVTLPVNVVKGIANAAEQRKAAAVEEEPPKRKTSKSGTSQKKKATTKKKTSPKKVGSKSNGNTKKTANKKAAGKRGAK